VFFVGAEERWSGCFLSSMIYQITGTIAGYSERGVYIRQGGMVYEVLLTTYDRADIASRRQPGDEISLYTVFYLEGGGGGSFSPVLIGFQNEKARQFFQLFIRVEGISAASALRMLSIPVDRFARAVEEQDAIFLSSLRSIGERTAKKIIASLSGKMTPFFSGPEQQDLKPEEFPGRGESQARGESRSGGQSQGRGRQEELQQEVLQVLGQLGFSAAESRRLWERLEREGRLPSSTEEALRVIFRSCRGNREAGEPDVQ